MAANSVLQSFVARSALAEEIIRSLRARLNTVKQAKAAEWCSMETEKLRRENDSLKAEVDALVRKLSDTEERNGLRQIPLPRKTTAVVNVSVPAAVPCMDVSSPKVSSGNGSASVEKLHKDTTAAPSKGKKKVENKPESAASAAGEASKTNSADLPADCSRLLLKVGRVVKASKHPDADSLYVEEVDLAESRHRTVVSGLVKHVSLEQLQGRMGIFLCNLKAAKMRGVLSEAMIMCASTPDKVCIIDPPAGAEPGDFVVFEGYPGVPDEQLNPKKKTWEQVQPDLKTNEKGVATYKGDPFLVRGKGVCEAPGCSNFPIK